MGRILAVDDELDMLALLKMIIEGYSDHQVTATNNPLEAAEFLEKEIAAHAGGGCPRPARGGRLARGRARGGEGHRSSAIADPRQAPPQDQRISRKFRKVIE